jgi:hypothetical protein
MEEDSAEVRNQILFMVVCAVAGIAIWGTLIARMRVLIPVRHPYVAAAVFVGIINVAHYCWGFFHTTADGSDIPMRGLMTTVGDYWRVCIRILAFLTIGPSVHLRRAIALSKDNG